MHLHLVVSYSVTHDLQLTRLFCPWNFPGKKVGGLPFPSPGDLPNIGIKPTSPASPELADRFFFLPLSYPGSPNIGDINQFV